MTAADEYDWVETSKRYYNRGSLLPIDPQVNLSDLSAISTVKSIILGIVL
jgi:hypothetical protein